MTSTMTTASEKVEIPMPSGPAMSSRWILLAYFKEAKYESLRMLRMPAFSIPFLALPVLLYLLFAVVLFGDAARSDVNTARFLFTAFSVFGVIGPAMFGFGSTVAIEREQGLLRFKRALPMPTAAYLLAKMLMAMFFASIIMVTLIVPALTLGHLSLSARQAAAVMLINILGILPFCALGLYIGTLVSGRSAPGFVHLIYQPMLYLSGLFFPLRGFLRLAAPVWPAFYLDQLALRAVGSSSRGPVVLHVLVLAALMMVLAALAIRGSRAKRLQNRPRRTG
jgi:ABC-2 type transport system permease protein